MPAHSNGIFDGCTFAFAGNHSKSNFELSKIVSKHGGKHAFMVTNEVFRKLFYLALCSYPWFR